MSTVNAGNALVYAKPFRPNRTASIQLAAHWVFPASPPPMCLCHVTQISNARMYSVTPAVEALWQDLLARIGQMAEVPLTYMPYPAPQPLETLWARPDLGCVFMCGYPIALKLADVVPIAAPIPSAAWAGGKALYRTDLIVRRDSPFQTLEQTFGGVAGWTVDHSHSGFNAFRHHLLAYRTSARPKLYAEMRGNLVTARKILDSVLDGSIDVGPLDAYWHALIAKHLPDLTKDIRVVASTDLAPIPAFVASQHMPAAQVQRLRESFTSVSSATWFAPVREALLIDGFAAVSQQSFTQTLDWDAEAKAAGFPYPA